jgi:hypothetical protein
VALVEAEFCSMIVRAETGRWSLSHEKDDGRL